jgi:hypothetical protein
MTIDEIIEELDESKDYPASDPASDEALDGAIDIMRKYQKIEQIANDKNINGDLLRMSAIRWVLEHGDDDNKL